MPIPLKRLKTPMAPGVPTPLASTRSIMTLSLTERLLRFCANAAAGASKSETARMRLTMRRILIPLFLVNTAPGEKAPPRAGSEWRLSTFTRRTERSAVLAAVDASNPAAFANIRVQGHVEADPVSSRIEITVLPHADSQRDLGELAAHRSVRRRQDKRDSVDDNCLLLDEQARRKHRACRSKVGNGRAIHRRRGHSGMSGVDIDVIADTRARNNHRRENGERD